MEDVMVLCMRVSAHTQKKTLGAVTGQRRESFPRIPPQTEWHSRGPRG